MMRFWREEYSRPERRGPSTAMSVMVHVVLILLAVLATNPPPGLESLWNLANRVYYLPPPSQVSPSPEQTAQLKYAEIAPTGLGAGFARSPVPMAEASKHHLTFEVPGDLGTELSAIAESRRRQGADSVFSVVDVDSGVTRDPSSVAPEYPEALRKLGIEGSVQARYVVDSTGFADPETLEIVRATRLEFAISVRNALPGMHFTPAKIGPRRVRQLVSQEFTFKMEKAKPDSAASKKPPGTG
ncbi:MAG TPA: energy transducer TonB [Gemmatimonadaceae bacterium]|jgi:hypothetical protein